MSAWTLTARPPDRLFHLVLESHDGRAPGADSEEKHEPVSDIDTVVVDSLKALDPEWPIREADVHPRSCYVAFVPKAEVAVIRSVELIVQPDAKDVVGCCPRYRLTSDTGCIEALVEIGPSYTSATISRLARRKGYIEGASAE